MWYCKFLLDVIKMLKKKCCDRRKFGGKFVEDLGGKFVLQKEDVIMQKVRIKSL